MIPIEWLLAAQKRINGLISETPLTYDETLGVFFKWENQQTTGSFKLRGAANKILALQDWERDNGIITCSAGNHGQGCALVAQKLNIKCEVYASSHAVPVKVAAMKDLGAEVHLVAFIIREQILVDRLSRHRTGGLFEHRRSRHLGGYRFGGGRSSGTLRLTLVLLSNRLQRYAHTHNG